MNRIPSFSNKGSGDLWIQVVNMIAEPAGKTCLDLCCCEMTTIRRVPFDSITGVDVIDWKTRWPTARFIQSDALTFLKNTREHFDVGICSDGIEHLKKEDGGSLLWWAVLRCNLVIVFTPMNNLVQEHLTESHPDKHKSLWSTSDFDDSWNLIEFPNWHPNTGEFFAWRYV